MNGLGQAIAIELSSATANVTNEDKKAHKKIVDIIKQWLIKVEIFPDSDDSDDSDYLIKSIINAEEPDYIYAQIETLEFLGWLKKLAQAKIEVKENDT